MLRGTWAPEIDERAYTMTDVSRLLRHSSISVTGKHYAALTLDALPVGLGLHRVAVGLVGPSENTCDADALEKAAPEI